MKREVKRKNQTTRINSVLGTDWVDHKEERIKKVIQWFVPKDLLKTASTIFYTTKLSIL